MPTALIALGSNVGERAQNLGRAVQAIAGLPGTCLASVSSWHRTSPIGGPPGQGEFLNGAIVVETNMPAPELHQALKQIEHEAGRKPSARWAERLLDLDLLLYGDQVIKTPELSVPHPRMAFRRFVLAPAAEVAAEMRHPVLGWTIAEMLMHLETATPYVAIHASDAAQRHELARRVAALTAARLIEDPNGADLESERSAGCNFPAALKLLRSRAALLARRDWPVDERWTISSFWLDLQQSPNAQWNDSQRQEFATAAQSAARETVQPKFVVWVGPVHSKVPTSLTGARPTLLLSAQDIDQNVTDVVAAMESMR